jgi:hypothetical protein
MALIPPVLQGRLMFWNFARSVKLEFRYFRKKPNDQFLAEVLATCSSRQIAVAKDTRFWRARRGAVHDKSAVATEIDNITILGATVPYPPDQMIPRTENWQSEGRANPRGISYLYLGTNLNTALAEVRPWIGSLVSVGEFATARELTVIDCSKYHPGILGAYPEADAPREEGFWSEIDMAFARPVERDDDVKDYIPTQIMSEFFRSEGFDGIQYKSLLDDEGHNVALFNLDDAELRSCSLLEVHGLKFECWDKRRTYRTGGIAIPTND